MERKFDLDERVIEFASLIIDVAEKLPKTIPGNHLAGQLVRSGTAPALHTVKPNQPNQDKILFTR